MVEHVLKKDYILVYFFINMLYPNTKKPISYSFQIRITHTGLFFVDHLYASFNKHAIDQKSQTKIVLKFIKK